MPAGATVLNMRSLRRTAVRTALALSPALLIAVAVPAQQQEEGLWRASSQTARAITGDVAFAPNRLTMNFLAFPISRIRALGNEEIDAAFSPDPGAQGNGSLFRLNIPSSQKFLHKNTICGSDDATWLATFLSGRTLALKFFSGQKPPDLSPEALANSSDLCGTYIYSR